jgi:Amino acid transporters
VKDGNKISFCAAVLMSINIMVGAGIFVAVGPMTEIAGNLSFLGWSLTGLLLFPIILGLSKASHIFSGEGGFYHYCSSGISPLVGVIAHWVYIFGYMGAAASLSTVLRNGLSELSGNVFIENYPFVFNLALVSFYTLINLISVGKISKLQSVGTLLKITPIVGVIFLMAFYYTPDLEFNLSGLNNISMTFSTAIFAYMGFEACCSIGGILRDGPQKVGSVVLTAFFVTMSLYTLFHLGLLYIMGGENLATYGALGFPYFLGLSPTVGAAVQIGVSFAILFSWANSILSMSLGNITNIYTLAKNRLILAGQFLSKVNSHQRPVYIALVYGIALFVYITVVKDVEVLFALTNLCVGIAISLTMVAVFLTLLRQKKYQQLVIPFLSFGSCAVWIYYSCLKIPNVFYVVPLAIGLIIGVVMFEIQKYRQAFRG